MLIDSLRDGNTKKPHDCLSEREMQTLLYIAKGAKRASIAQALCLSPKTISVYRARVMEKLGLVTDAAIAAYAVRHKLVD
jgi:DNA-binding NarL/FixJ family response regulator